MEEQASTGNDNNLEYPNFVGQNYSSP